MDRCCQFHEAVERLPAEDREAFGLTFYHGWSQQPIAELFGMDERTVRRRVGRAVDAIGRQPGGRLPGG